jgi:nucleotide-binding universal stress UspA family protein
METIVVGFDRSHSSPSVARWAGDAAARVGAELVVVHALADLQAETSPEDLEHLVSQRVEAVEQAWPDAASAGGARTRILVRPGDPREILGQVADEEDADLVVLGRSGQGGGPGLLHLGSVVEYAAHHWPRPLAVIPSHPGTVERIALGVDGSPDSLAAVRWCAAVAPAFGAEVVAINVEEPVAEWTPASSPENWRRGAEHRIEEWTAPLSAVGVKVQAVVQRDLRPADALLGVTSAVGSDLLVVGMRGVGGFTGLRVGGVALKVLHRASLPLVLVPQVE